MAKSYLSDAEVSWLKNLVLNGPILEERFKTVHDVNARKRLLEIGACAMVVLKGKQSGCAATYQGQHLYAEVYDRPVERNVHSVSELPSRVIRRS